MKFDPKILTITALGFLLNTSGSLLAPYYPTVAAKYSVSNFLIGLVLASHAIGCFFFSLILTRRLSIWGRRNLMLIGVSLHLIGNALLGSLEYFQGFKAFLGVSIGGRFLQGVGFAAFTTAGLAIIPLIYTDQEERIEGFIEVASSLGVMMGPLLGSFLYTVGGYETPFFCLAGLEVCFFLLMFRSFKNELSSRVRADSKIRRVSICKIFLTRQGVFAILIVIVAVSSYNFMDPSLSYRLGIFHVSADLFGLFFTVSTCAYIISMLLIERFSASIDKRVWMASGNMVLASAFYFLLYKDLWGLSYGLMAVGLGAALILIPALQQYRRMAMQIYAEKDTLSEINDLTSGMFSSAYAVGELLGPIGGGVLVDQFGFTDAVKWFGLGLFGFFLLYLYVGDSLIGFLSVLLEGVEGSNQEESKQARAHFSARRFTVLREED